MYIKNIFNIKNFKGIEDNFKVNFDDITYIIGDNAKNKTTIGSLPLWILTGYNLYGSNRENVSNDSTNSLNSLASMTLIDNSGSEHTITRCKGKDNFVMLDGVRTTQEILARFYKDIHAFICSYNPSFFRSIDLAKQRELLLRILPTVSSKDIFKLLEEPEQEILEKPVEDVKGFCKTKRAEIKELKSDLDKIKGSKNICIDIAIQKEDKIKEFTKQYELNELENQYERLITSTEDLISLEDLETDIKKLNERITKNIKIELQKLQEQQSKELNNLKNVSSVSSNCPTCKQEIHNENLIKSLSISYKKNINAIAERIENLKEETQKLIEKKNMQIKKYERLKNPEIQKQSKIINELKDKIDKLQKEKSEIDLYNREIMIKHQQIEKAKKQIEEFDKISEEITNDIDKYTKQIQIATRFNILMIQEQMKKVSQYLDKVSIEFNKIDEDTGEILDDYQIKYDGRNYEKLSKSYKLRADIEIAQLINKVTDIKTPMFIDDTESATQITFDSNIQTILSKVIKYNDLEILYSYQDVLIRERESINKTINESSTLLQNAA